MHLRLDLQEVDQAAPAEARNLYLCSARRCAASATGSLPYCYRSTLRVEWDRSRLALPTLALLGSALMTLGIGLIGARSISAGCLWQHAADDRHGAGIAFCTYAVVLLVAFWARSIPPPAASASPFPSSTRSRSLGCGYSPFEDVARWLMRRAGRSGRRARFTKSRRAGGHGPIAPGGSEAMFVLYAVLGAIEPDVPPEFRRAGADRKDPSLRWGRRAASSEAGGLGVSTHLPAGSPCVPPCAVAVQQVRHVARGRRRVLLLVGCPGGVLLSRRGLAVAAHRAGEHHGVHAYPIEHLPDRGGRGAEPRGRPGAAAGARSAVADGCADTLLVRDGGRDATRTSGGGERHSRPAHLAAAASPAIAGALRPARRGRS